MVFNSVVFLFCFLPASLVLYYLVPGKAKNAVLLAESLLFYCWGGVRFLPLIVILVAVNYLAGLLMQRVILGSSARRAIFVISTVITLGALIFFKYTNFLLGIFHQISGAGLSSLTFLDVLPMGISYYTFKLISYAADVCSGKVEAERNPVAFGAYAVFFPQLIVGPIVKYTDMQETLHNISHRYTLPQIEAGAEMFVFGLAKKVLLADSVSALWHGIIDLNGGVGLANASTPLAWLGIAAYSLQLYFDFAGYSEMSNGLAKMMGFDCPDNFNLPYISSSITEFWRRWHITLSQWFRDYIYIPLGGNRRGLARQIFNMMVVWALTGIWHGANWNFICWGLYYFLLLTIEKSFLLKYLKKGRIWPHLYTLFLVVFGWGIFTANEPGVGLGLLFNKLFIPQGGVSILYFIRSYGVIFLVCLLCASELPRKCWAWLRQRTPARLVVLGCVMLLSVAYVVAATNSAALYAGF